MLRVLPVLPEPRGTGDPRVTSLGILVLAVLWRDLVKVLGEGGPTPLQGQPEETQHSQEGRTVTANKTTPAPELLTEPPVTPTTIQHLSIGL